MFMRSSKVVIANLRVENAKSERKREGWQEEEEEVGGSKG